MSVRSLRHVLGSRTFVPRLDQVAGSEDKVTVVLPRLVDIDIQFVLERTNPSLEVVPYPIQHDP